jgi:CBS domain containing-hemolysin-like protein
MTWLAIGICAVVSFIFSGIEAGILSVNRVRLKHRVKLRDEAALALDRLLSAPERLLVTVLVVTNLMNIFALTLATQELVRWFGNAGYVAGGVAAFPIYYVGLELLPKSLFRRFPYRALAALAGLIRVADIALTPLHFVGGIVARAIVRERPAEGQKLFLAREEFKYLTIESERTGTLTPAERQMIHNVVDFRGVDATQVMLPLERVQSIPGSTRISELLARSRELKIERWPVLSETGEISGLVNVFDVALDARRDDRVEKWQRRIVKVGPRDPAHAVLRKLRAARATIAAVVDEHARALGIVTSEDLIRRLVNPAAA